MMSRDEWIGAGIGVVAICATIGVSSCSTNARIDDLRADIQADMQDVRADLRDLRNDVGDLRGEVSSLHRSLGAHTAGQVHDPGPG